jgi:hypothetical protein
MIVRIRRPLTGAPFIHPMDPAPRTAILARGFQETSTVRVFPYGWNDRAERFRPTSVAGAPEQLRKLTLKNIRLDHAVIAFTYEGQSGISHEDRELFWNAFGVPVFEQILGLRNELLAMECDAHCGLHVVNGCADLHLERGVCACGSSAPRLSRTARIEELAEMLV